MAEFNNILIMTKIAKYNLDQIKEIFKNNDCELLSKDNKIIEVKSKFTFRINIVKNMIKALHTRKLGYKFEFWIIDRNELVYII